MGGEYYRLRYAYAVLFGLLAAELAIQAVISSVYGLHKPGQFLLDVAVVPFLLLWVLHVPIWAVLSRKPEPTRWIVQTYRANFVWLALVLALFALAWFKAGNVASLKTAIPLIVPFYADPALAEMDRLLFFGVDPWRITHALVGPWGTAVTDWLYTSWHMTQIGFGIWMVLTRNSVLQTTALIAFTLCWILLGGIAAVMFSSVGPVFYAEFYGSGYFQPLTEIIARDAQWSTFVRDYLLDNYSTGTIGSGISAFPSMHVAVAVWEVLVVRMAFRNRYLTFAACLWPAFVLFGSVHLGWHYAVDGAFSIVGTVLIWRASAGLVARFHRHVGRVEDAGRASVGPVQPAVQVRD
jgi:hypothetical protein